MRPVTLFGQPSETESIEVRLAWLIDAVNQISLASQRDDTAIFDNFRIDNPPAFLRVLDGTAGTLSDVRGVLSTLISDMKRRGPNSASG